jgi:hypothetical protein
MGLGPVSGIRQVNPVNVPEKQHDLLPEPAPDRSGRMDDDDYREGGDETERGLADDDPETSEQDQNDTAPDRRINLIA